MLKSVFDSAGDLDSREYDVLTLGGYVAEYRHWQRIEREWLKAVLWAWSKCKVPPGKYPLFHMTELMSFSNPFSRRNGWGEGLRDDLLKKCLGVIDQAYGRGHIHAVSATVVLKDFKAVQHVPTTPPLQLSCGGFCLGHALAWKQKVFQADGAELFYDRGDPFVGYVRDRWNNPKERKTYPVWELVKAIGEIDCKIVPAGQMADFLVWSINASEREPIADWQLELISLKRDKLRLDAETLAKPNARGIELFLEMKLPHRRGVR